MVQKMGGGTFMNSPEINKSKESQNPGRLNRANSESSIDQDTRRYKVQFKIDVPLLLIVIAFLIIGLLIKRGLGSKVLCVIQSLYIYRATMRT